ncbi:MAG: oligosaccharide flippase family protein [Syntrophothermus sp.]
MSLLKSTVLYSVVALFSRSLGFLLLPFYSNLISAEEFGIYSLIMSAYAVLSAVYQGGLFAGFSKYYVEAEEAQKKTVFSTLFILILLISFTFSYTATEFKTVLSGLLLQSVQYDRLIFIAAWMLFADTVFATMLHLLKTMEQADKATYYTAAMAFFNLLLNIIFVFYQRKGIEGILLAQLFSSSIVAAAMFPLFIENISIRINTAVLKKIILFSFPLLIAGIFSTLVDVVDRFLLDHYLSKTDVGIYSFSYRIAMIMNVFVISFGTAWTPYFLRMYKNEKSYSALFGKNLTKLVSISMMIFLAVALLTGDLFNIDMSGFKFINHSYLPGIVIIPFILTGYAIRGLIGFYSVYPYVSGKSYHFLVCDALAFAVNIGLNLLFIPIWGIKGAAAATMISFAAGLAYLFIISRSIRIVYQLRELGIVLISGLVLYLAAYYINSAAADIIAMVIYAIVVQRTLRIGLPKA